MEQFENYVRTSLRTVRKDRLEYFPYKYTIKEDKGKVVIVECKVYKDISYEEFINRMVRAKYTIDEEFAVLRQRDTKPEEFKEYNDYVESCKSRAKQFVIDREANFREKASE